MGEVPQLLEVSPAQGFRVSVVLNKDHKLELVVRNTGDETVAFKVKTTNRERYFVKPTTGTIKPKDKQICAIVLKKMKEYPPNEDSKLRDKFLIQSVPLTGSQAQHITDLAVFWKDLEKRHRPKENIYSYNDSQRIKCRLVLPKPVNSPIQEEPEAEQSDLINSPSPRSNSPPPYNSPSLAGPLSGALVGVAGVKGEGSGASGPTSTSKSSSNSKLLSASASKSLDVNANSNAIKLQSDANVNAIKIQHESALKALQQDLELQKRENKRMRDNHKKELERAQHSMTKRNTMEEGGYLLQKWHIILISVLFFFFGRVMS